MTSDFQSGAQGDDPQAAPAQAPPPSTEPRGYQETESQAQAPAGDGVLWTLLRRLTDQTVTLVRQEFLLARAELREAMQSYARHSIRIGAGAAILVAGILVLLAAAVAGLFVGLNRALPWYVAAWLSPLIIGGIAAMVGAIMIGRARRALRQTHLKPQKTIDTVRADAQWVKDRLR
jgi:hypothetical protein